MHHYLWILDNIPLFANFSSKTCGLHIHPSRTYAELNLRLHGWMILFVPKANNYNRSETNLKIPPTINQNLLYTSINHPLARIALHLGSGDNIIIAHFSLSHPVQSGQWERRLRLRNTLYPQNIRTYPYCCIVHLHWCPLLFPILTLTCVTGEPSLVQQHEHIALQFWSHIRACPTSPTCTTIR